MDQYAAVADWDLSTRKVIAEGRKTHPAMALYLWLVAITGARRGELCALQVPGAYGLHLPADDVSIWLGAPIARAVALAALAALGLSGDPVHARGADVW